MAIDYEHVGVIGTMAGEVERLHHHLVTEIVTEQAGRVYRHGMLAGQRVTVVQSRIGKVAAALTAASLIGATTSTRSSSRASPVPSTTPPRSASSNSRRIRD